MKSRNLIIGAVLAVLVIFVFMGCNGYNSLVDQDEAVERTWNDVETQYQRRSDLIQNLVNTVKGEASFERGTLEAVINARSRATSVQISPDNLTEENIGRFEQAQSQLSGALSRLLVTVEQYPTLQTNKSFANLQTEIAGTENRIATARRDFNGAIQSYNTKVRRFPTNIFAGIMGFDRRTGFKATEGSEVAPTVDFSEPEARPQVNFDTTNR